MNDLYFLYIQILDKYGIPEIFGDITFPILPFCIIAAAIILIIKTTWTGCAPSVQVISSNFPDWKSWCLLGGAFVAGYWGKINPIYVILAGAVLGIILY